MWRKKFLENSQYRAMLIHRYTTHMSTTFKPSRVLAKIDEITDVLRPAMPNHIERWKNEVAAPGFTPIGTMASWEKNIDSLKLFAINRPQHFYSHMKAYYSLSTTVHVEVINRNTSGGAVYVAGIRLHDDTLSGDYFQDVPLSIKAVPKPGFKFVQWSNGDSHSEIAVSLDSDTSLSVDFIQSNENISCKEFPEKSAVRIYRRNNSIIIHGISASLSETVISVTDLKGRVLEKRHVKNSINAVVFDVGLMSRGMYLLSVFSSDVNLHWKTVVY